MPNRQIERELKQGKPVVSLEVEATLNIQRTSDFLVRWINKVLEPAELQGDEYNVLRILRGAGAEGRTSSDIRERMIQDKGRLPALLHGLRKRGFIEGSFKVAITPAGLEMLASTDSMLEGAIEERLSRVGQDKLRTAIEVMERLRAD